MNRMKSVFTTICIFISATLWAQHSLELIWETDTTLQFPEEVVYEPGGEFLFVSILDGSPFENDGKGAIGKIRLDGEIIDHEWVTGLDAPKGMRLYKKLLYVAELSEVVVIDMEKAEIISRIPVEGASLLHNFDIDPEGIVYVSDMFGGRIHRIENGEVSTYLEGLNRPGGIQLEGSDMYIFTADGLLKADADKNLTTFSDGMDERANGIVKVKDNEFILTCWGGVVYYVYADGSNQVLLDTREERIPGGINMYDKERRIMYMTTDQHNTVRAYKLK